MSQNTVQFSKISADSQHGVSQNPTEPTPSPWSSTAHKSSPPCSGLPRAPSPAKATSHEHHGPPTVNPVLTCSSCYSSPPWSRLHPRPKCPQQRKSAPPGRRSSTPRQRSQCTSAETAKEGEQGDNIDLQGVSFTLHHYCKNKAREPGRWLPLADTTPDLMHS